MDLAVFTPAQLPAALRAMWTVAHANGSITEPEAQLFTAIAAMHGASLPPLGPITSAEVAAAIPDPHARKRLVQLAIVTAMVDGEPTHEQEAAVRMFSEALDQEHAGVGLLKDVAGKHRLMARFDLMRRLLGSMPLGDTTLERVRGATAMFRALSGHAKPDPELAWRFKKLGLLPEGTLGREYWRFCTSRGFLMPGEPGMAIIEQMVFHDMAHVLSGYDTDLDGEIRQGSFQAGNRREDGFVFLLFVLTQMHLGIAINPNVEVKKGLFDIPAVMEAVARGAACKVDLTEKWNFWEVVDRPVVELRKELGIAPINFGGAGVMRSVGAASLDA